MLSKDRIGPTIYSGSRWQNPPRESGLHGLQYQFLITRLQGPEPSIIYPEQLVTFQQLAKIEPSDLPEELQVSNRSYYEPSEHWTYFFGIAGRKPIFCLATPREAYLYWDLDPTINPPELPANFYLSF